MVRSEGEDDTRTMGRRRSGTAGAVATRSSLAVVGRESFRGIYRLSSVAAARSAGDGTGVVEEMKETDDGRGEDGEMLAAFEGAKGKDGLLGLDGFRAFTDVRELLENGLLKDTEVVEIWKGVSKTNAAGDRIDYVGFCEVFSKVDALFVEEEEDDDDEDNDGTGDRGADDFSFSTAAESFVELVGSRSGVLSLHGLLSWSEVTELIEEKLLTRQEVEAMWEGLPKTEGGIDLGGFWTFDRQLSDLFEEDEEGGDYEDNAGVTAPEGSTSDDTAVPLAAAVAQDGQTSSQLRQQQQALPKEQARVPESKEDEEVGEQQTLDVRFAELTGKPAAEGLLSLDGLTRWSEVSDLLEDDLLSQEELQEIWGRLPKVGERGASIDLAGFVVFSHKLDQLFETVEEEAESAQSSTSSSTPTQAPAAVTPKPQQLPLLPTPKVAAVAAAGSGEEGAATAKAHLLELAQAEMADCGMGCGENKRAKMMEAMEALMSTREGNLVLADDVGDGLISKLEGEWRLLFTSSNSMEFNQGLTGLANTIPNARFSGLRQILHVDGMVFDAEYEEELAVGNDSEEPLVITVTSDWEVKRTSSLITGESTVAVSVSPKQIKYGFITVRAERWKTLRAMMLLDIAYLDNDMRIMRGQTARQNFFVFVRV